MAAPSSPYLRAKNPFPTLWFALVGMALLTLLALGLSIGQWQRPTLGVVVDPFGLVDNFGWPSWNGYQQGLAYPDRLVAVDEYTLTGRIGAEVDKLAARGMQGAAHPIKLLVEQGSELRVTTVHAEPLGFAAWALLSGGYVLLAWAWLCAAGLLYTVRPQSRAVGAFVRLVLISTSLLITLFDFHTTRKLVPVTLCALACLPASMIEFGLCFPERLPSLQARPRLLSLLRLVDVLFVGMLVGGYLWGHNFRAVCDLANAAAIILLTVILSLRCATAHGRRRVQLLMALLVLLPIYVILGTLLLWGPERAAPYLYVFVIPLSVFGALGLAYALLRYDMWDSRALLRRPGIRPLLTASLSFVVSLVCVLGYIAVRKSTDALPMIYMLLVVSLSMPLVRRAADGIDSKLFPTEVHYRDTVEQLSLRFTDLSSQSAVIEAVEQAVRQVVDCARVRLLPMPGPLWTPGTDSAGLGRFLPKVAQAMAAAITNEKLQIPEPLPAPQTDTGSSPAIEKAPLVSPPTPLENRNLRALRRIAKTAALFALSPENEAALLRGELVYLTPKTAMLVSSVPALWSWLLIGVRFRDRIVGILAVAPKSVAQIFTSTSESLLRTIANQAALGLYCASVSEQSEILLRAQEAQAREKLDFTLAVLADELAALLPPEGAVTSAPATKDTPSGVFVLEQMQALALSKTLSRQPQQLRPLLERTRQLLRPRLIARLLEVDVSPSLEVDCDSEALVQILQDLLTNALDACPAPCRVGVTAGIEADQRLRISIWDGGADALILYEKLLPLVASAEKRAIGFRQIVAQRLVRAHGWEISAARRGERNSIDIVVPAQDCRRRRQSEGSEEDDEASGI